jgi:hypothetical protein
MNQVQLSESLYEEAQRRASDAGYGSVDDYVADILEKDLNDEMDNLDHLFTSKRIAHIHRVQEDIKAGGQTYSTEEVRDFLASNREEWLANHPS